LKQKSKQTKKIRRSLIIFLVTFFGLFIVFIFYVAFLAKTVINRCQGAIWDIPSRVYSAPMQVYSGIDLAGAGFYERLKKLGYRKIKRIPEIPGRFFVDSELIYLYQRSIEYPFAMDSRLIKMFCRKRKVIKILNESSGKILTRLSLEPVELAAFYGKKREERYLVNLSQVPKHFIDAVLSMEDRRFYEHGGLDLRGILRALYRNFVAGGVKEGGSTITQQLIKNIFLTPERTIWRKVNEAIISLIVEFTYSKDKILEIYLNEVYLGQKGSVEIHGIGEAARFYFGRSVENLDLDQSAILAGLIKAPNRYSPYKNPAFAVTRRNLVLKTLLTLKKITPSQYEEAVKVPVNTEKYFYGKVSAPYFVDYAVNQIRDIYPRDALGSLGLSLFTTLDVEIQAWTRNAVKSGLKKLEAESCNRLKKGSLQAAALVLEPATGRILAMVGGRDYSKSQFNRAAHAMRQPGSLIKPLVYAAALKKGYNEATLVRDAPVSIKNADGSLWSPSNFAGKYYGNVPLIKSLAFSLNAATVKLTQEIGFDSVYRLGAEMGLPDRIPFIPSFVLGACEMTPLEMAHFYSIFAGSGFSSQILSIRSLFDSKGTRLPMKRMSIKEVLSPGLCLVVTDMLKCATLYGTGKKLADYGLAGVPGKTGTSNNGRDAWFAGYHNGYLAVVWVGMDDNRPAPITGSKAALPIWGEIMKRISTNRPSRGGLGAVKLFKKRICIDSGGVASSACPSPWDSVFIHKYEADALGLCPVHKKKKKWLWR